MSNPRRFYDGWQEQVGGVWFRVVRGRKSADDLVLQMWVGEWVIVTMALGALMADFLGENEDYLYPPPYDGGDKYMRHLWKARHHGYQMAEADLLEEKYAKRQREQQEDGYDYSG